MGKKTGVVDLVAEVTPVAASDGCAAAWQEKVGAFATAVGKPLEAVNEALAAVCGAPSEAALAVLADEESSPLADLKEALAELKIPSGVLRQSVTLLRGPKTAPVGATVFQGYGALPVMPNEASFIESLKVGGVLRPGQTDVIAACRSGLAEKVEYYSLPKKILTGIFDYTKSRKQLLDRRYWDLKKQLAKNYYADILEALGLPGEAVNPKSKQEFLNKVNAKMWQALYDFNCLVAEWNDRFLASGNNNMAFLSAFVAVQAGGSVPASMQIPDTTYLREAVDAFIETVNEIFSPDGLPIARALAVDAGRINELINDESIYTALGKSDREAMLQGLGATTVTSDYLTMEKSLPHFALSVMCFKDVPIGTELGYLSALYQLGGSIPWHKLIPEVNTPQAIGRGDGINQRRLVR